MTKPSKRIQWFSIAAALVLVALACSTGGETGSPTEGNSPDLAGTQAALEGTQSALEAAQTQAAGAGAEAEEVTTEPSQPTDDSSADEPPAYFLSEWDSIDELEWWIYELTNGIDDEWDLYVDRGTLTFDMQGRNIWAYLFYDAYDYTDIRLDMEVRNVGANNNNVSLICRDNARGWYEFNIANNGLYWIFRYDRATGNYTQLYNGGAEEIRTGKETNWYTAICDGSTLSLGVNGTEVRTVKDSTFVEGRAGISVSSFDTLPVIVEVNWVEIGQP